MSERLVFYFTATEHRLYRWSGGALGYEARFSADERGVDEFRQYLKRRKGALVHLVADLAGEDFHEDQIPYLRGRDRQTVIQRRLAQRYRDTRLAAALSLGYVAEERRNERLLLASFTNVQQFIPWLDVLAEADARLSGVYSTPILAPALAARLGAGRGRSFVVSPNRAGLRQCFMENGRLRFARLERSAESTPETLAESVRTETERMSQYLATLRALPREGPPVRVIVIAPEGARARFEKTLVSDARFAFRTVGMADAARMVGLRGTPRDIGAEQLYLHLAVKQPPKEQFARSEDRHSFVLWRMQRAIVAAGALGLAACAAYAGVQWMERVNTHEQVDALQRDTRITQQQVQRITAAFPVTQTSTDNLKATVLEFRNIAARTASPEEALAVLSRALEQFPQIELDALAWSVGPPGAGGEAKSPSAQAAKPAAADLWPTMEISGRVSPAMRADYRTITAQVQRFAARLDAEQDWQIVRTQLPFDITPEGTLTGDIGEAGGAERSPRFTIVIARKR